MGFILREKKDGRRTAGYGIYLAGGLIGFFGIYYLHHHITADSAQLQRRPNPPSNLTPITQPASVMAPIEVKDSHAATGAIASFRQTPKAIPPAKRKPLSNARDSESFDAINLALKETPASAPGDGENLAGGLSQSRDASPTGQIPAFAQLAPAFPPAVEGFPKEPSPHPAQLLAYRDPDADADAPAVERPPSFGKTAVRSQTAIPRGTLISAVLLTTVDSGNPAATIQFAAANPAVFNHRYQLGFGTRFLGKMAGQPVRDRLNLTADTILYPDGSQLPIAATAVEADLEGRDIRPGVGAYYFPPPTWAQLSPYLADFITGYVGLLESRAEQPLTASVGGVSLQTTNTADPRAPLYQASGQAIQAFTQARLKDIEQRYATHYLIPAGTRCWLELDRDCRLNAAPAAAPSAPTSATLPLSNQATSK